MLMLLYARVAICLYPRAIVAFDAFGFGGPSMSSNSFSVIHLLRHTYGARSTYIDEDTDHVKISHRSLLERGTAIILWTSTWIILERLKPSFQHTC